MTKRVAWLGALALSVMLVSCAGPAGDVSVLQSGASVRPSASLAWAPLQQNEMRNGDPRIDNDIIRQRVRTAVESALAARGHRFVQDSSAAQYTVTYHIGLEDRQQQRADSMASPSGVVCGWRGCISGYGWGMFGAPTSMRTIRYVEGTMILDLTDRATGQLVWRATSQRRIDEGDGAQERINAAVADMVRTLP